MFKHFLILILTIPLAFSQTQNNPKRVHPASKKLATLMTTYFRAPSSAASLTKAQLDTLVSLFKQNEALAMAPYSSQYWAYDGTNQDSLYQFLNVLSVRYVKNPNCILFLIRLYEIIRMNVELAEGMPAFVAQAAINNTKGFVTVYSKLSEEERDSLVNGFDWGVDFNVDSVFTNYAKEVSDPLLKKAALDIVSRTLKVE